MLQTVPDIGLNHVSWESLKQNYRFFHFLHINISLNFAPISEKQCVQVYDGKLSRDQSMRTSFYVPFFQISA